MRIAAASLLLAELFAGGCASREKQSNAKARTDSTAARPEAAASVAPDTTPSATTPVVTTPRVPQAATATATALVGTWDLAPPAGRRGPHLTVVIDSARHTRFYGRLTRVLSGDMEMSENFQPLRGTIDTTGVADLPIRTREPGLPESRLTGRVSAGRWTLTRFVWSGEEQVGPRSAWELRKAGK